MNDKTACPHRTALDTAEELLSRYEHLHSDPEAARGRLVLMREIHNRLHDSMPCEPVADDRGQLVCPLMAAANDVYSYAFGPGAQGGWAVPLDVIATGRDGAQIGMLL